MNIEYTAQRTLISGHTAGTTYDFDVSVNRYDRSSKANVDESKSIDMSTVQRLYHGTEESYAIQTIAYKDDSTIVAQMRELLDSVADGSTFAVDLYGTTATADDPITVTLIGSEYTETRVSMHYIQFAFEVRRALP